LFSQGQPSGIFIPNKDDDDDDEWQRQEKASNKAIIQGIEDMKY
jgi:hypothetical protein